MDKSYNYVYRNKKKSYTSGMINKQTVGGRAADIIIALFLILCCFVFIVPIWHVIMASLSNGKILSAKSGLVLFPVGDINFNGYKLVFADASIVRGYLNTIIYVVGATFFSLALNISAGYALSRDTMLKKPLIMLVLITVMFSGGLIPTYMVIRTLGWVGSMWAILIPGCTNAMYMMIMMSGFNDVPKESVEAAYIDGAGHFRIMMRIMLPQTMSIVTIIVLFSVVQQWNSWFPASIYLSSKRDLWPLQLWIKQIVAQNTGFLTSTNPNYDRYLIQYASIVIATIPILAAFPFFQKYIEKGVLIGGVKG